MAAYSTFTNLLRGEDHGDFHSLRFLRDGTHQEINAVLNGIGGGGGGAVSSATLPLSISNGVISIDLSSYSNTTAMSAYVTTALVSYVTSTALTNVLSGYTDTTALSVLLATKLDGITVSAPLVVSGTGTSRALSSLWKPSNLTIGAGLFALPDDMLGTYGLSLTGLESRAQLRLSDTNNVIRELTSNTSGDVLWNNAALATQTQVAG